MKKVTITLEFEGESAEYIDAKSGGVDVGLLLRDALADFRIERTPPYAYVTKRYADSDDRFRRFKLGDVTKRIEFSAVLSNALVTINVSDEGPPPPRRCGSVWVPGVLHPPGSTAPEVKTRCALPAGHDGLHSYEPPAGECPEGGYHVFTPDEEYDGGQTIINCEKCGALQPEEK